MIIGHEKDILGTKLDSSQLKGVLKKVLVSPAEGWDGYVMRVFELDEGGYSPKHSHEWPHINYVVRGKGTLHIEGKDYSVEEGSYAYVPSNKNHQFLNAGSEKFAFICIVPEEGEI